MAIIGAGMGGCSAAYFAHKIIPSCEITVYERSDRVGGRVYGIDVEDKSIEIGAAFFKNSNQMIIGLLKELDLEMKPIQTPSSIGVWNGKKFIVKINNPIISGIRLFLRHPVNIARVFSIVRAVNKRNNIVYREVRNRPGEWDELFAEAGISEWLRRPLRDMLLERGVDSGFVANMVEPVTRVIYNQNSVINAYAGLSAINTLYGRSYNIDSGNELIPRRLLEVSEAATKMGVAVEGIVKGEDGSYEVSGSGLSDKFDSVIISNHGSYDKGKGTQLQMEGSSKRFQQVYVQIVRGELKNSYFNLRPGKTPPNTIISTKDVPFTHIIKIESGERRPIYSIASTTPIDDYLADIFEKHEVVFKHSWEKAYPVLEPIQKMPKCRLDKWLFYASCTELATSAMEVSVLSAFNSVNLLRKELDDKSSG